MRTCYGLAAITAMVLTLAPPIRAEWNRSAADKTPQQAVKELLAAERAFSKASAQTDVVSGLTAMFAPDL